MSGSKSKWRNLLEEKEKRLNASTGETYTVPDGLFDEDEFRSRFNDFCSKNGVIKGRRRHLQLSQKHGSSRSSIIKLSKIADEYAPELRGSAHDGILESLVWKVLLAALELPCQFGLDYECVIDLQVQLNSNVPKLDPSQDRFPGNELIQEALMEMYGGFLNSCLDMLKFLSTNTFDSNKGSSHDFLAGHAIQKIVRDAKNQILAAKTKYDHGINVATEYKEVQKQPDLTGPSAVPIDPSSEVLENEFALYFKKQACIGEGSHGKVYKVQETSTKELYACKFSRLPPTFLQKDRKASIQRGIFTLKKLRHIHIVTIVTYRENREGFTILMEPLADYDLSNMFSGHTSSTKAEDRADLMYPWFGCLLNALSFAHAHAVKHRDIKPENILVKDKHIYLSDFSLAKDFTGQLMSVSLSEEVRGTLHYRAPETHDGTPGGRRADVFSLGCVYSEMLTFIHGKSTKDFLKRRQTENETGMFRKSLEAVRNWLGDINKGLAENSPSKQVVITTRRMLEEDWEFRYQSHIAMRSIEDKDELRCRHSMR